MGIVKVVTLLLLLSIQYFNIILISTFCFIYIYIYVRALECDQFGCTCDLIFQGCD